MSHPSPIIRKASISSINYAVIVGTAVLVVALVIAGIRQSRPPWYEYTGSAQVRVITPTLTGEPELCLTCHYGIEEISEAHPLDAFGCVLCHGGDPLSLDEDTAHAGLIGGANPSDLSVVQQGCGGSDCHSGSAEEARDHIARVERSVQSTYAGAIYQVLLDYDLVEEGPPYYGVQAVQDDVQEHPGTAAELLAFDSGAFDHPAVETFSEECLTCHLQTESIQEPYYYRSTGCAACHVVYSADGYYRGADPTISKDEPGHMAQHRLTTQIPFTQCNTCHNRGTYSVEQMTFDARDDVPAPHALPADTNESRLAQYYHPTELYTLCEWELDCVDCHTSTEAMGDADLYLSQYDIQSVQCKTCHGTLDELPEFTTITDNNDVAIRRASLNPFYDVKIGTQVLLAPDGDTLGAVQLIGEQVVQIGKVTGKRYIVPMVMGSECEQDPEQQQAYYCHECHDYHSTGQ